MTNSTVLKGRSMGIAFAALVLLALAITPVTALADGLDGYSYDYFVSDSYSGGNSYDYFVPDSYSSGYSYDYFVPDYSYGNNYYTPSYSSPGFSYYTPSYSSSAAVSSVYAPTNTCTAPNSCNDNSVFNAPTVVTVTDYDNDNDRDYDKKKKKQKDYDYEHVSYRAPYVTLSQVPYTGLELGPVGTALYWSFLVIWCLIAAYLIVVKRVQNTILHKLNTFLFGESAPVAANTAHGLSQRDLQALASMLRSNVETKQTPVPSVPAKADADATDEFVLSQINRSRR